MSESNTKNSKGSNGGGGMTKGRKRQYHNSAASANNGNSGNNNRSRYQPKRGAPGIILSCDTGRDGKAKREGLDIINYYFKLQTSKNVEEEKEEEEKKEENKSTKEELSLEEELAQLKNINNENDGKDDDTKKTASKQHGPFAEYDTGCRGTVFMMCTLPNCALVHIPRVRSNNNKEEEEEEDDTTKTAGDDDEPSSKKAKTEDENEKEKEKEKEEEKAEAKAASSDEKQKGTPTKNNNATTGTSSTTTSTPAPPSPPKWDPTDTVRRVMNDLHQESLTDKRNFDIPGSRFVIRMIPMQATCFASIEEITITFRALLDHWILPKLSTDDAKQQQQQQQQYTYAIKFKKRNCGNVTRDQVINGVVEEIDQATSKGGNNNNNNNNKEWKVNLDKPDFRIQVEICKTLCGISILKASQEDELMVKHNFNLADLRANAAAARKSGIATKKEDEKKTQDDNGDGDGDAKA